MFCFDLGINKKRVTGILCTFLLFCMLIPINVSASQKVADIGDETAARYANSRIYFRTVTSEAKSVRFSKTSMRQIKGEEFIPVLVGEPTIPRTEVTLGKVNYRVGNTNVLQIVEEKDKTKFLAKNTGSTYIYASFANGKTAKCLVNVEENYPIRISLNHSQKELKKGDSAKFSVEVEQGSISVTPSDAYKNVTYRVGNPKIAKVSSTGVVTGLSNGNTYLYAKMKNGMETKSLIKVVSKKVAITKVSLPAKTQASLYEKVKLKVGISPENADDEDIKWSVGNAKIASVDKNGVVTAKAQGSTYIYAKAPSGAIGKTLLKVTPYDESKEIHLSKQKQYIQLKDSDTLYVSGLSSDDQEERITYRIGNSNIAKVTKSTNFSVTVKGLSKGSTWLYAKSPNGYETKCLVIVSETGKLSGIDAASSYELAIGANNKIENNIVNFYGVKGQEDFSFAKDATYKVGNTSIATVKDGRIYGKKVGNTTLTITCQGQTKKVLIKVYDDTITKLNVKTKKIVIDASKTHYASIDFTVDNPKGRIAFTTGNNEIANVYSDGIVYINTKNGSTYAYLTLPNGQCEKVLITVKNVKEVKAIKLPAKIDINLSKSSDNDIFNLNDYIYPSDASGSLGDYTIKVGNENVARVDAHRIEPTGVGKTKLTVTAPNGVSASTIIDVHNY